MKTAIIVGASGLVGSKLLEELLKGTDYKEVIAITRGELGLQHPKLVQLIVDFEKIEHHAAALKGDVLFCCLGTTKAKTPDKAVYRKIEYTYPTELALLAKNNGAKQVHYISSLGADVSSSTSYLKLKGETELKLQHIDMPAVHIYRPSLITGDRKDARWLEHLATSIFKFIDPLLAGRLKKYRSISALTIAKAMYKQSLSTEEGIFIHPSDHISNLA